MTIHAATLTGSEFKCVLSTNAMNAEQVKILSASGSIKIPKFVINFRERAILPSKKSVKLPRLKIKSASVWRKGICHGQKSIHRKIAVSAKRETVNLFGKFIQKSRAEFIKHFCVGLHLADQKF
jgi:hypothetical protein